jgi:ectoine hydroxylase-related dioxygenase (phytanoyl-CoA dioxygenase family)
MTSLPALESIYPITPEMQARFKSNGSVVLRGVCSVRELSAYAEVIEDEFWRAHGLPTRPTLAKPTMKAENLWRHAPSVANFTLAKRFARAAAELMEVPSVRLWRDEARFTEPGGKAEPWHQDQAGADAERMVTMWIPLHLVPAEMMGPKVALGSHEKGQLEAPEDSERHFGQYIAERKLAMHQIQEMVPGDAVFLEGWVLQGVPANYSRWTREVMTITYVDARTEMDAAEHPVLYGG